MKKWNNPELFMMGIGNTNEDDLYGNHHTCHATSVTDCENGENHNDPTKEHQFSGKYCAIHGPGNSKCCCLQDVSIS